MSLRFPGDSKSRNGFPRPSTISWSILSGCVPALLGPPFSAVSMLVDFDRGVVQHQGRLIYNVLGNQFLKNMLPNTLLAPSLEPGVHTFPRAIPLRPVPPLGSLYSASTISHWASSGCLFPAFLHALAFPAATGLSLFSTVPLSFHVVSFFYFIICLKTLSRARCSVSLYVFTSPSSSSSFMVQKMPMFARSSRNSATGSCGRPHALAITSGMK